MLPSLHCYHYVALITWPWILCHTCPSLLSLPSLLPLTRLTAFGGGAGTGQRGVLSQNSSFKYGLANTCSPNDSFYNASDGSYSNGTVFNIVWSTRVPELLLFITPARGLLRTEQFLILLAQHCIALRRIASHCIPLHSLA